MQDGSARAEEAGAWLRKNQPDIRISWDITEDLDEDAYRRLLKLLFSPRADSGTGLRSRPYTTTPAARARR